MRDGEAVFTKVLAEVLIIFHDSSAVSGITDVLKSPAR